MRARAGLERREAGSGFTLIEILLATILLLLLLGAVVFNFTSLERGVRLDEGAAQFEALLRYARAQALSSGRQVRVVFEGDLDPGIFLVLDAVRVTWEPDPLGRPGVFEDLPQTQAYVEGINELVQVDNLRLTDPGQVGSPPEGMEPGAGDGAQEEQLDFLPPIRFHPDGSCDSAEIVLVSRDLDDTRRVSLRLVGITGAIRRSVLEEGGLSGSETNEPVTTEVEKRTPPASRERPAPASSPAKPEITPDRAGPP